MGARRGNGGRGDWSAWIKGADAFRAWGNLRALLRKDKAAFVAEVKRLYAELGPSRGCPA